MQVHYSMNGLPEIKAPVVTVGSFDGVHAGHRAIIGRLRNLAAEIRGSSVLITFYPHPRRVLYPDTAGKDLRMINSQEEKIRLLDEIGLDHLIIIEFTKDFARTTSDEFVEHFLVGKLHAHTIVVGFNHFFGHNREGNYDSLYRSRTRFSFRVEEIPEQEIQNETVSSTRIRKALREGNIQRANAYLEHYYMIRGKLGERSGQENQEAQAFRQIALSDPLKLLPPGGTYAASFRHFHRQEKALIRLGEGGPEFVPLESEADPGAVELTIYLHMRISGPGERDHIDLLDVVRELIY